MDYLIIGLLLLLFLAPIIVKKIRENAILFSKGDINGYVYIISNPSFEKGIYKIGMTEDLDYKKRIKQLYSTAVPTPFEIEFIIGHKDPRYLEKYFHNKFSKNRINKRREFFKLSKNELKYFKDF